MRRVTALLLSSAVLTATGCGIFSVGREISDSGVKQFTPNPRDYRDDANSDAGYADEYSIVGKEGRGDQQKEREWDKWTPWLMSPKAMAIEKNCGYDY